MEAMKKWTFQNSKSTIFEMKMLMDGLINRLNTIEEKFDEIKDKSFCVKKRGNKSPFTFKLIRSHLSYPRAEVSTLCDCKSLSRRGCFWSEGKRKKGGMQRPSVEQIRL